MSIRRSLALTLGICLSGAELLSSWGQTRTWNLIGGGVWNNNANWTPYASSYSGSTFPNAIDATAILGSSITANSALTLGQDITLGTLSISDDNSYTLNAGNTLTFDVSSGSAYLTIGSSGSPVIDAALSLNDALILNQGSSGTLSLNGLISGSSSLTKLGSGTVTLTADNTLSEAVTIGGGTLSLAGANGGLNSVSGLTIRSGGTLLLDNTVNNDTTRIASGVTLGGGTFDFSINTASGSYSETAGALSLVAGANSVLTDRAASGQTSTLTFSSLSRTAASGATVDFSGTGLGSSTRNRIVFTTAPTLVNGIIGGWATYGGTDWATYGGNGVAAYASYDTGSQTGWISTDNAKPGSDQSLTANRNLYTLNLGSGIDVNLNTRVLNLYGGGLLKQGATASAIYTSSSGYVTAGGTGSGELLVHVNSGTLLNLGAPIKNNPSSGVVSLVKAGLGTLNLSTNVDSTYSGTTRLNAGTVVMNRRQNLSANSLTIDGNADLQVTWTSSSSYAPPTSITITNGSITRTVNSATATRFLTGASATLTINGAANLVDQGTTAGGYLGLDGPVVVNDGGTLTLNAVNANSQVVLGGAQGITINAGGTLATTGSGAKKISDSSARAITATGTSVAEATLSLGAGTTYHSGTTLTINGSGTGGLRVSGAQTAVDNFLTSSRVNSLGGSGGTLTVAYTDASGNFNWTKAPASASSVKLGLDASSTAVVYELGAAADDMGSWSGLVIKGGKVTLEANQTTMGTLDLNGGVLQLAGTTSVGGKELWLSGDANLRGGQLDEGPGGGGTGLLKVQGNIVSDGTVMVNGPRITMNPASGTTTLSGSFPLYQVGYFTKDSAGTVRLDQELGATTLEIHAGTLLLGADQRIVNTTSMILSGGTLATGGYDETVGILSLQARSDLDLGSGTSVLHFANSTSASWSGGALVVYNWSGSTNGGGTDQLFFGSNESGLTATQLGMIAFNEPYGAGSGLYDAEFIPGGSGELRPRRLIPEPGTVGFLGLLLGAVAYRERARAQRLWGALRRLLRRR